MSQHSPTAVIRTVRGGLAACLLGLASIARSGDYQVLDIGQLAPQWTQTVRGGFHLPKAVYRHHTSGCVAVGFAIEADGKPDNITALRAGHLDGDPADLDAVKQAAIDAAATWRFDPGPDNAARRPAYTYTTITFNASLVPSDKKQVEARQAAVGAACHLDDFPGMVARGELVRH